MTAMNARTTYRILTTLCLLFVGSVARIAAAPPGEPAGRWWTNPRVVDRLGLKEQQVSAIDEIMYDSGQKMIDLKASMEKTNLQLGRMLARETLDEKALNAAIDRLAEIKCLITREELSTRYAIAKVLNLEQRTKLREFFDRLKRERRLERRQDERPRPPRHPLH